MAIRKIKVCALCGAEQENNTYWGDEFAGMKVEAPHGDRMGANSHKWEGLVCQDCATEFTKWWYAFKVERAPTNV